LFSKQSGKVVPVAQILHWFGTPGLTAAPLSHTNIVIYLTEVQLDPKLQILNHT